MESIALAAVVIFVLFFVFGGDDMVKAIFDSKAKAAHERRLEAEARAKEAQHNTESGRSPRL